MLQRDPGARLYSADEPSTGEVLKRGKPTRNLITSRNAPLGMTAPCSAEGKSGLLRQYT